MADGINLTALAAPTSLLVPTDSTGVIFTLTGLTGEILSATKAVLSGSLTAATYKEIVSISVPGWLRICGISTRDATSRTLGLKIIIDGTTVYDAVTGPVAANNGGYYAVGIISSVGDSFEQIRFNSSLSLQIKSSITETDKIQLLYSTVV